MHYVITSFNTDPLQQPKHWDAVVNGILRAQEEAEFEWVVFAHVHTRGEQARTLYSCKHLATILYSDEDWFPALHTWVWKQNLDSLITTHVPNDVVIAPDYIKRVQEALDPLLGIYFLRSPYGYEHDGSMHQAEGEMLTLFEQHPTFDTVFGNKPEHHIVRTLSGRNWIKFVEESNGKPISAEGWPEETGVL